jgi:hypothetical protein
MDFIRRLLREAPQHLTADGVLVLEIGHERAHFEAAFPTLDVVWLPTSAGDDQVLLLARTLPSDDHPDRKNITLRRGAKVCCRRQRHPATPARRSAWSAQRRRQVQPVRAAHRPAACRCRRLEMPPRWRMGEVAQDMPETDEGATDFVLQGDLPLMRPGRTGGGRGRRRRPRHGRGPPRWTRPAPSTPASRAQALLLGLGFKHRPAGRAGQQLLGRLAHAPATGARADVPGRPAAAGRAHQPPGPGRAGLAGSLAQALRRH